MSSLRPRQAEGQGPRSPLAGSIARRFTPGAAGSARLARVRAVTATSVALLRAVNVAGHGRVRMAELAGVFRDLGCADVSTYIQSGNVVFSSDRAIGDAEVERAIEAALGLVTTVVVRSAAELEAVVESNPFPGAAPSELHVGFAAAPPHDAPDVADLARFAPERAVIDGAHFYLHLPLGMGRAKLPAHLGRVLRAPVTYRSWKTVTALADLAATGGPGV